MDFISVTYLAFLAILIALYYVFPKNKQWILLLVFSVLFYSCFSLSMWGFMLATVLTTYSAARVIGARRNAAGFMEKKDARENGSEETSDKKLDKTSDKKLDKTSDKSSLLILFFTILFNVTLLLGLKTCTSDLSFAINHNLGRFSFLVPVGISFYTLQTIAYMVDVYKGKIQAQKNIFKYLLFITFFPQILQGPIPRYEELGEQLFAGHEFDEDAIKKGFYLLLWGYFLKMVIADRCNIVVNQIFGGYTTYDGIYMWIAGILYSLQLYADFFGCVCIAMGSAEALGISLPQNFNHPYLATSIQDFWRRWHMSLSSFLKDYVYIPLGGNRKGTLRKYINLMLTFLVSGIWHGMGMHFIVWGLMHGFYQVMGGLLRPLRAWGMKVTGLKAGSGTQVWLSRLFTSFLVMIAWVFFRAENTSKAMYMVRHMFAKANLWIFVSGEIYGLGLVEEEWLLLILCIVALMIVGVLHERGIKIREGFLQQPIWMRWSVLMLLIFVILIAGIYGPGYDSAQFIYGNF